MSMPDLTLYSGTTWEGLGGKLCYFRDFLWVRHCGHNGSWPTCATTPTNINRTGLTAECL